ncbi:MAG: ABC transporter ATP-binding protein [Acidobacteriota bacterium]
MNSDPLVQLNGVHRGFGRRGKVRPVLRGIDLEVAPGELVCLTGRSGAGKTTLLHIVSGLERADEGDVLLNGQDLNRLGESGRAGLRARTVGIVFQAFNLLEHLTVGENVMLPAAFLRGWKGNARDRAVEVLDRVGLGDRFESLPRVLSGGERQRVALARALFAVPALLICDEVTANLDLETAGEVVALIDSLRRDENIAVLAATHDEALVRLADRRLQLEDGLLR